MRFRLVRIVIAAALVSTVVAASGGIAVAQTANQTWEVQVGSGIEPKPPMTFEPNAYGPDPLAIRVNDKVVWAPVLGHTLTFLAGKPEPALILPGSAPGELLAGPGFAPIGSPPVPAALAPASTAPTRSARATSRRCPTPCPS